MIAMSLLYVKAKTVIRYSASSFSDIPFCHPQTFMYRLQHGLDFCILASINHQRYIFIASVKKVTFLLLLVCLSVYAKNN